ncbi:radical SAM family heme chaperone HemW [Persicimonas caeni]|uniref:radical SAM family heme chaperone HemW n=1 Tax=Persicimonas caeni TaxID=2292766 RepID=UPI00143D38BC|nr:radical SAM family heme chaperone HemW [Persicimonas caeni]
MAAEVEKQGRSEGRPLVRRRSDSAVGIYVHVPFCARQCPYCDFAVDVRRTIPHREYADALLEEFESRKSALDGRSVRTIYFGGGTPSMWEPSEFRRVLQRLRASVGDDLVEICMEANPVDIRRDPLDAWVDAGVTRLSIGCQSFQPRVLKILNRIHTRDQALAAVELAIEHGPEVVSLDLIFGNPEQTMQEWERDLDVVEGLQGLKHVSAYNLTIEPGTAFSRRVDRGRLSVPDEDRCFDMLERLIERCEAMGFERYEVSNFARPGFRSRHNTLYWTGAEYLGLGVGAHSLCIDSEVGVYRRANPRQTAKYLADPEAADGVEHLSEMEHFIERLFLGIRTREGLDFDEVRHQFVEVIDEDLLRKARAELEGFCVQGFMEARGAVFVPTHKGLNLGDSLAERLAVLGDGV